VLDNLPHWAGRSSPPFGAEPVIAAALMPPRRTSGMGYVTHSARV